MRAGEKGSDFFQPENQESTELGRALYVDNIQKKQGTSRNSTMKVKGRTSTSSAPVPDPQHIQTRPLNLQPESKDKEAISSMFLPSVVDGAMVPICIDSQFPYFSNLWLRGPTTISATTKK